MVKAYESYAKRTLKFMEIVKSATTGKVKNVKVDNSILYLEYSENSVVEVAKIINEANLTHGNIESRRDVIAIGESEIEIIIEYGIRNYTNLTGNIVLTFYTSLEKIDVKLYTNIQDKSKIIVEVSNKKKVLEKFKGYEEELGESCLLGGDWVYNAIKQGYFERSGRYLIRSEVIRESSKKWAEHKELRKISDSRREVSR